MCLKEYYNCILSIQKTDLQSDLNPKACTDLNIITDVLVGVQVQYDKKEKHYLSLCANDFSLFAGVSKEILSIIFYTGIVSKLISRK